MKTHKKFSDMLVVGFATFAVFFGAGNLIFPPYLGMKAGGRWFSGFACFYILDVGLAFITVLAIIRKDRSPDTVMHRLGPFFSKLLAALGILCVGPLIAIPRMCATTYELGIAPLFGDVNTLLFSVIFFGLVLILTIRPSKVVDIIGRFLTPVLLVTLAVLVVRGMTHPIGPIASTPQVVSVTKEGTIAGYQAMDVFTALSITLVLVGTAKEKGYHKAKDRFTIIAGASLIAAIGLFGVYCGLCFLGATTSTLNLGDINRTELLEYITQQLLGNAGVILMALIVTFACLTSAVGLGSSAAQYFSDLSKGKLSYKLLVVVTCVMGVALSSLGIDFIIAFAQPILDIIYPVIIVMILLSFFDEKISKSAVFKGAAILTGITSALTVAQNYIPGLNITGRLPFAEYGFEWAVPAVCGIVLGAILGSKDRARG